LKDTHNNFYAINPSVFRTFLVRPWRIQQLKINADDESCDIIHCIVCRKKPKIVVSKGASQLFVRLPWLTRIRRGRTPTEKKKRRWLINQRRFFFFGCIRMQVYPKSKRTISVLIMQYIFHRPKEKGLRSKRFQVLFYISLIYNSLTYFLIHTQTF